MNSRFFNAIRFLFACLALTLCVPLPTAGAEDASRPNILWLSSEDISPHLGCYGDAHARTPNLDRFAAQGVLYQNAFVVAPVCAPCRSSIITGMYPTTLGSHNMRSRIRLPEHVKCFPEYLRAAGYYCTNNSKTDYQFDPPATAWDESSGKAHWKNRPSSGQPFFAVFNFTGTHESRVRGDSPAYEDAVHSLGQEDLHDPAALELPPYHPDTPAVRQDWARYYNCVTAMDKWVGGHLHELEEAGLADDTIVFFWGDHGVGLPRGKRWLYDSGLRVPLMVRIPDKFRNKGQGAPGTKTDELVVLMDLGPTVLNLCNVDVPEHMQGRAFLGENLSPERKHVFAARDRMDEYYDMTRSVRDKRFKYIRNYEPWKPYAQPLRYAEESPTMQELRRLKTSGDLPEGAAAFMAATKPVEELYDTQVDPHELHNLVDDPRYYETLRFMQVAHDNWIRDTLDLGFIPEAQLEEAEEAVGSRYEVLRRDRQLSGRRLQELFGVAQLAGDAFGARGGTIRQKLLERVRLTDDAALRFWIARWAGQHVATSSEARSALAAALGDADDSVRVAAATWLAGTEDSQQALDQFAAALGSENWWTRLRAANVLELLGANTPAVVEQIRKTHEEATGAGNDPIGAGYVARTTQTLLEKVGNN
jgi:uncharacterized sulfatase